MNLRKNVGDKMSDNNKEDNLFINKEECESCELKDLCILILVCTMSIVLASIICYMFFNIGG